MLNFVLSFINNNTADDLSRLFLPHEAVVLKYALGDLAEEDGWTAKAFDGVLPVLRELNSGRNCYNARLLEEHLRCVEDGFDLQTRLFVNGLKVCFNEIFTKSLSESFNDNRERYIAALRRQAFLRTAFVIIVSTMTSRPGVCSSSGGRRTAKAHLTRPDYLRDLSGLAASSG